jgi:hypothetical protein
MNRAPRIRGLTTFSLVAALASLAAEAHAAPPGGQEGAEASQSQAPVNHWYGYQPLVVDGAALTLAISGMAGKSNGLIATGVGPGLLVPPILHLVHGNVGYGIASFFIRACAPVTLGFVAFLASSGNWATGGGTDPNAIYAGILTGWGIAAALDAALFSWEKVTPPPRRDALERGGSWFTWRPDVAFGQSRGTVGIAGTF